MANRISRRTVLRGVGTVVALPVLDAMLPRARAVGVAAVAAPRRMAFIYVPNGCHMQDWTPATEGATDALTAVSSSFRATRSITVRDASVRVGDPGPARL